MRWKNGMLFETEEEAEQHLKEQELLFRIKKWAEIYNEGWKTRFDKSWTSKMVYSLQYTCRQFYSAQYARF